MGAAVIKAEQLRKTYSVNGNDIIALDGLSFEVQEGEVFALIGPNGSGKTTTFNIFANLTTASSGTATVCGLSPGEDGYFSRVSFVSCETQFLWALTGEEILKFYARLNRVSEQKVREVSMKLECQDLISRRWSQLSSGGRMRLRLAKALLTSPQILFLDEPTVGLDPDISDRFRVELKALREEGVAIILTSHHMLDVEELADTICFLNKGKAASCGPLSQYPEMVPWAELTFTTPLKEPPSFVRPMGKITYSVDLQDLPKALLLGHVKDIKTHEPDLETFFISQVRKNNLNRTGQNYE